MLKQYVNHTTALGSAAEDPFRYSPSSGLYSRSKVPVKMFPRQIAHTTCRQVRHLSSLSPAAIASLDTWISSEKQMSVKDHLSSRHISNLYITLPTRDGTQRPYVAPGGTLPYGHHLVFFNPRNPERALRNDGTDADFCPPEPFTRRMWAGGKMFWHQPLSLTGDVATAIFNIQSVDKKGFDTDFPMVFVKQHIQYMNAQNAVCVEEERSHVYLSSAGNSRSVKQGNSSDHASILNELTMTFGSTWSSQV